jgi:hypothetical protein
VGVSGLLAAMQQALPDLRASHGAVLVTGGALALYEPQMNAIAVQWGSMGLALAKAAQHKLAGMLHERLKDDGVYVGEIMVRGLVKGTAYDLPAFRRAGRAAAETLALVGTRIAPGVRTVKIDQWVRAETERQGGGAIELLDQSRPLALLLSP